MRAADDEWRIVEWTVSRRRDAEPGAVVLIGRDVTERLRMESELLHQATHDLLTGLPNRKALLALAAVAVNEATPARPVAVLMIDLDRFKEVNDSLGHAAGNKLLQAVAGRLSGCLRAEDFLARLGGDEFALIQLGIADPAKAAADGPADHRADRRTVNIGLDQFCEGWRKFFSKRRYRGRREILAIGGPESGEHVVPFDLRVAKRVRHRPVQQVRVRPADQRVRRRVHRERDGHALVEQEVGEQEAVQEPRALSHRLRIEERKLGTKRVGLRLVIAEHRGGTRHVLAHARAEAVERAAPDQLTHLRGDLRVKRHVALTVEF
ncbi:MAG: GGDEF domain-containing protein [Gammaproteobacteria bacterium]|nr:GGDEF domain-containing protein [Gammaproteobacteria bacterium]